MNKTDYQKPTCDVLVVRFEENIMSVNGGANYSPKRGVAGGDDEYSDGESF